MKKAEKRIFLEYNKDEVLCKNMLQKSKIENNLRLELKTIFQNTRESLKDLNE